MLAVLMLVALAPAVSHAQVAAIDDALSVYNLGITPQPIIAGSNITINFQLYNSYDSALQNVNLQLTSSSAIINVSPAASYLIGTVGTGQYGGVSGDVFTTHLHLPSTLAAGEYTLDVVGTYETSYASETLPGTSTSPISFYVYGTPNIQLTASPVGQITPGGQSTVQLGMINTGTDTARNLSVIVLNSTYFTPYGSPRTNFGIVAAGSTGAAQLTLQTSAQLPIGNVTIPVRISYTAQDGKNYSYPSNIPLSFVPSSPNIVASVESASPSQLYAGSNQTLTVLVQNIGYGDAKNLSVKFLSTGALSVSGAATNFYVGTLPAGQSKTVSVFISASSNANFTNYTMPVSLSYRNINYQKNISTIQYIPVNLQSSSIFTVTGVSSALTAGGAYQAITYTIKNTGSEPAQQLSVNLQTVFPVSPVNANYYIAQLNPGQSVNATFYVNIDSHGNTGSYPVTLYEQWRQPNGYTTQQYFGSNNYFVSVAGTGSSSSGSNDYTYIAVVVIIIIAVVVAYKRGIIKIPTQKKK